MSAVIEAAGLVKRFGKIVALDGLDLAAEPGRVRAVLGPNGTGKTTFVRIGPLCWGRTAGRCAWRESMRYGNRAGCAGHRPWPRSTRRSRAR